MKERKKHFRSALSAVILALAVSAAMPHTGYASSDEETLRALEEVILWQDGEMANPLADPNLDLNTFLQNVNLTDALKAGRFLFDTVRSDEFQALLAYPEGKALIEECLKGGTELIFEDTELTGKILTTLGLPENAVDLLVENLNKLKDAGLDINKMIESEKGQEALHFFVSNLDNSEYLDKIESIFELAGV